MDRAVGWSLLACVCCVLAASAAGVTAGAGAGEPGGGTTLVPQTEGVDPDGVVLRAAVAPNGSANWTVAYRIRLDDRNTTDAFESLQADVRANRSAYVDRFAGRMNRTVNAASNATGREMSLANVTVTAEQRQLPQSYGVVSYRFVWHGFARLDGDRIVVGDALAGLFLDAESRLIVAWPPGYAAEAVAPAGYEEREGAVVWEGPVDFGPDRPRVVLRPAGGFPYAIVAVGALLVLGAVAVYRRRGGAGERATAGGVGPDDGPAGGPDVGPHDGPDDRPGDEGDDDVPAELLSPEERVLRFVGERGGRVKQQEVVEGFDWTAARTSQVVGSLRESGELETFRLGRENVLTIPGEGELEPTGGDDGDDGDGSADGGDGEDEEDESAGVDWRP